MLTRRSTLAGLLVAISLLAPPLKAQTKAGPNGTARLRAAIARLETAYGRQDLKTIMSMYTPDALFLPDEGEAVRGPQNIRKYLGAEVGTRHFERQVLALEVDGNLAYEVANQTVTIREPGRPPRILKDKYVHIWKKQKDGSWKIAVDMYNWRDKTSH